MLQSQVDHSDDMQMQIITPEEVMENAQKYISREKELTIGDIFKDALSLKPSEKAFFKQFMELVWLIQEKGD